MFSESLIGSAWAVGRWISGGRCGESETRAVYGDALLGFSCGFLHLAVPRGGTPYSRLKARLKAASDS